MPPASSLVGPCGTQTILALQRRRIDASNATCVHLHCVSCHSEWSHRWRTSSQQQQLSSRVVVDRESHSNSKLKWSHGRSQPFGRFSPCRALGRDEAPESEDEEKSSFERGNSRPGLKARSLVGTYAASTALAVQESLPPEGVIVLLACLVGVLTGGSVVLFNLAVHAVPCSHVQLV